jgi:transcriptional regulator with XRE-family HTH domain
VTFPTKGNKVEKIPGGYKVTVETIALDAAKTLEWGEKQAKLLKGLRKPVMGRDPFAKRMEELGLEPRCSPQYLQKIEENRIAGINRELLLNILKVLGQPLGAFYTVSFQEIVVSQEEVITKSS